VTAAGGEPFVRRGGVRGWFLVGGHHGGSVEFAAWDGSADYISRSGRFLVVDLVLPAGDVADTERWWADHVYLPHTWYVGSLVAPSHRDSDQKVSFLRLSDYSASSAVSLA
jgi:hypothetical protein